MISRPSPMMSSGDPIFQKTLQDLVKGMRAHKSDYSAFVSQAIADAKLELKSTDPIIKAEAVRKLTYLQMFGYNISWASFSIVEVMSQIRFAHKRIGYLAANQSFTETTDVVLLTTNLFKKEFASSSPDAQYEIGLAINCIANIVTKDLARDCITDVVNLMTHTRPYVRKRAVLVMYKLFVKFPQGLRLTFDKLKELLDDPDASVTSCAVNVICELANKNPRNYLSLAPKFFKLLTTSSNNWMLIKVVKLLASLVPEEPRLARKLLEPLATIVQNTGAKSLQYECIYAITEAMPYTKREDGTDVKSAPAIIKLCSDHLRTFIEESDQNLKYLGLVGLVSLMKSHPKSIMEHRDIVLKCLNDDDVTIRIRSLELLSGIVSKRSLQDLVNHLMEHVRRSEGNYRDEIIAKVLQMCSKEKYALVTDFAWYIAILVDLAVIAGSKHGNEVAQQIIDIALRVETVRPFAVEKTLSLLLDDSIILGQARHTVAEVLRAAAWVVGEYSVFVSAIADDIADDEDVANNEELGYWIEGPNGVDMRSNWRGQELHRLVMEALLHPRVTNLPVHVLCANIQAAMKIFVRSCGDCLETEVSDIIGVVRSKLGVFLQSQHVEVQERASTLRHMLAEFGILSLDWQSQIEKSQERKENEKSTGDSKGNALMDMMTFEPIDAKAIDTLGAAAAKRSTHVLLAAIAEPFYPVHSKAQRKVPVPNGLNIDAPINGSALRKLLAVELPKTISMASIAFCPADPSVYTSSSGFGSSFSSLAGDHSSSNASFGRPEPFSADASSFSRSIEAPGSYSNSRSEYGEITSLAASVSNPVTSNRRGAEDDPFYLQSQQGAHGNGRRWQQQPPIATGDASTGDINPLSQLLAESFDESKSKKKKDKKGGHSRNDKSHRKRSVAASEINTKEMLPIGAQDSDDEPLPAGGRKYKFQHSALNGNAKSISRGGNEAGGLENVDITTPLRDDEVLVAPRHREVPLQPSADTNSYSDKQHEHEQSKDAKKKKEKKDKKGTKEKKENRERKDQPNASTENTVSDLLSFDWAATESTQVISASALLVPIQESQHSAINGTTNLLPSSPSNKKETKIKRHHGWLRLTSEQRFTIVYCFEQTPDPKTFLLTFKAINNLADGTSLSIDITIDNVDSIAHFPTLSGKRLVSIGRQIPAGGDAKKTLEFALSMGSLSSILHVGCQVQCLRDAVVPESSSVRGLAIKISPCIAFVSHVVDEDAFATIVSKNTRHMGAESVKVAITGKFRSVVKSVAGLLHGYVVEGEEVSKAASICAKTPSGGNVCCMIKQLKDSQIRVDVKCFCGSSSSESQQNASVVVTSISELML